MLKLFIYISFICLISSNSYAYLDPGTGGSLLQMILGMFAAAASIVAYYWNKVKIFFLELFKKNNDKDNPPKKDESQQS